MSRFYFALVVVVLTPLTSYAQSPTTKPFDSIVELEAQQRLEAKKIERLENEKAASTQPLSDGQSIADKKAIFTKQIDQSITRDERILQIPNGDGKPKLIEQIKWKNVIKSKINEIPNVQLKTLLGDLNKQMSEYKSELVKFQKLPPTKPDDPFMSPKSAAEILVKYFVDKGQFSNPSYLGYGTANTNGFFLFEKGYEPIPEMMDRNGEVECGFQVLCVTNGGFLRVIQVSIDASKEDGKWYPLKLEVGKEMIRPPNEVLQAFINTPAPAREPTKPALCFDNTKLLIGPVSTPRDYLFIFDAN